MLGTRGVGGDEGQIDVRLHRRGEFHLGFFRRFLEALQGHLVAPEVDSLILLEFTHQMIDDPLIEVFSTQVGIPVGGLHLEYAFTQFEDGDIEGAPSQVEHGDLLVLFLVQSIGQGGRRRLVDDPKDIQTGDLARVLRGLALGVIEIGRNGDHGIRHFFSQIILRGLLHLDQDHRRDFCRAVCPSPHLNLGIPVGCLGNLEGTDALVILDFFGTIFPADEPFNGIHGVFRIGDGLTFGNLPYQPFAAFRKGNDGRRRSIAFLIRYNNGVSPFHDGNARIGRSQINPDNPSHRNFILLNVLWCCCIPVS
ncbi:MAG: NAD-specific glutamate dehydrogenase [Syntrophus sp. PtaU1.Bin208]|nr:MAG: NAD-specific glutamate dehydrogenase [Syntrophus sp. PtaU1.Bin208]